MQFVGEDAPQTTTSADVASARFEFERAEDAGRVNVTYLGGGSLLANRVFVVSPGGPETRWNALGSTAETANASLDPGTSAVLGPSVINWNRPVSTNESIRVVYRYRDGSPTTLATFSPEPQETTTQTTTDGPPTPLPQLAPEEYDFFDEFEHASFDRYEVVSGEPAQWRFDEQIDGTSLAVSAEKSQDGSEVVLSTDAFAWGGEGDIGVDVQVNTAHWNKHGLVLFGPAEQRWVVRLALEGQKLGLSNRTFGNLATRPIRLDPSSVHRLRISVVDRTVTVSVGEEVLSYEHDAPLEPGRVGLGLGSNSKKRGETWFDNFGVRNA